MDDKWWHVCVYLCSAVQTVRDEKVPDQHEQGAQETVPGQKVVEGKIDRWLIYRLIDI